MPLPLPVPLPLVVVPSKRFWGAVVSPRPKGMPEIDPKNPAEIAAWTGIWVFIEHHQGKIAKVSLELLGKGRELADQRGVKLTGILLGSGQKPLAEVCIQHGADKVIYVESPHLEKYSTEPYVEVCAQLVDSRKPEVFLIGASHTGRDFGSRIAVRKSRSASYLAAS